MELNIPLKATVYYLKSTTKNTRKSCEICSKLMIKLPERPHWCCCEVSLWTYFTTFSVVAFSNADFEQINVS